MSNLTCSEDDCTLPSIFQTFEIVLDYVLLVGSIAANALSVGVIYCAITLRRRSGDTMHVFVVSMAIADLFSTAYANPYVFLGSLQLIRTERVPCVSSLILLWLGASTSGLSLVLLNADKFVYFRWPLKYLLMTTRRAVILTALIWGTTVTCVSFIWAFGAAYVDDHPYCGSCVARVVQQKRFVYDVFIVCFSIVPVVSSLLLSIYLVRLTRRRRQRAEIYRNSQKLKAKLRSLAFIFAATAWTSLTLLPYRLWYVAAAYIPDPESCHAKNALYEIDMSLVYLLYLNPIVNPLITLFVHAPYRRLIKKKVALFRERFQQMATSAWCGRSG